MTSNDLEFHAFCLTRTGTRLDQFARAISSRIRPGDTVVDLGAGSGILSFLACAAGAARVYAIESSDTLSFAELLAAAGTFRDRIEFIHKPSTHVVLPERADAIVADIHDTFGLQQNGLAAWIDARDRLVKPGGVLIPSSIQLLAAPVEAPDLYRKTIDVWRQTVHGIDLSPLRAVAVNSLNAARFEAGQLLAAPTPLAAIDLAAAQALHVEGTALGQAGRDGTLHGVCGCFITTLADGIVMGNVPGDGGSTNFAQAFFPVATPVSIEAGDEIAIHVDTHDGAAARWQVDIAHRGQRIAHFDHSTFHAQSLRPETLRKQANDYRPTLTARGAMERALLEQFDGTRPASELEAWLTERFGNTLPSRREAAALLKTIIERCG